MILPSCVISGGYHGLHYPSAGISVGFHRSNPHCISTVSSCTTIRARLSAANISARDGKMDCSGHSTLLSAGVLANEQEQKIRTCVRFPSVTADCAKLT